jgi:RNA polymerase nonessential primary-like sigma factor
MDSTRKYLQDISRYPLLSRDEEYSLAQQIQDGGLASEKRSEGEPLTPEEVKLLARRDRAKQKMILHNLRLVVSIAKKYRFDHTGPELMDLIQEGAIGLSRAAEKFDHSKGYRFSTYATWWIRQAITRTFPSDRTIRLPIHLHERHRKIKKVIRDYRIQNSNRAPTLAEIAELTECSLGQVEDAIKHCRPIFSLNHKTNPEEGTELLELMGVTMPDSSEAVEAKAVIESVLESIAFWGQSDRELFILRHGLGGEEPLSLAKIAVRLGMKVEQAKGVEMRNKKKFDRIAKVRFPEYVQNSSTP